MGFGIGSLIEKISDKIGFDEDFGDLLGLAADGAAIGGLALWGAPLAAKPIGGIVLNAVVTGSLDDSLGHAADLVDDWGADPMTGADWKERIRSSGYASFEDAVASGQVDDDVMNDPGMQALRAEQEERQQTENDGRRTQAEIEARRTAIWRG